MNRSILSVPSVLLWSVLLSGCGSAPPDEVPLSPTIHECQSYTPVTATRTLESRWHSSTDERTAAFRAPADIGGGFIELELTTSNASVSPGFKVTTLEDRSGAILADNAVGTADPTTMRGGFSAASDQAYEITFTQGLGAPEAEYPVDFTLTWTYTGTLDCYEANDTALDAKQVPVGTSVRAHALAGYTRNQLTADRYDDWYRIVLNRPATLAAALSEAPGNHRMRARFWNADGSTALAGGEAAQRGETFDFSHAFEAGIYLMSVEVAEPEVADWDRDRVTPTFWAEPYALDLTEVTAPPAP